MRRFKKIMRCLVFIVCFACAFQVASALGVQTPDAPVNKQGPMLEPSDLFKEFPEIKWGMTSQEVRKAIERTGARPARQTKGDEPELVWWSTFNGMEGRARVYFKEGAGAIDVVVGVYAYEKQKEVFEAWLRKLIERHGAAQETSDNSIYISHVWRLKNGFVIELRSLKDINSPVVDVHWVKE